MIGSLRQVLLAAALSGGGVACVDLAAPRASGLL